MVYNMHRKILSNTDRSGLFPIVIVCDVLNVTMNAANVFRTKKMSNLKHEYTYTVFYIYNCKLNCLEITYRSLKNS